ncbi:MAG TPA: TetR/AcrR family transcriptional regulator [Solirubrobacterales bacterium]|nr:TetR/AcrR family transcriptional regulator [Solirubrobacterales bacterium]
MAASALRTIGGLDLDGNDSRRRIVDAMIDSCAEKTYAATTITDIVARARISRTTFYKQFDDKRACFDAAIAHCIAQLQEVAASAHDREDPPADAVRKGTTAVIEALAERPGLAQLLTGDAIAVDPRVIECYRKATIPALEGLWSRGNGDAKGHSDPRLAFGKAQVLILNHIALGKADRLPELLPEIVYLAVSPFGGHEAALQQSQFASESTASGAAPGER